MNKIDSYLNENVSYNLSTMKPVYSTNEKLMCGIIQYNNKTFLVDLKDKDRIINFNKNFIFIDEINLYPSYSSNYKL